MERQLTNRDCGPEQSSEHKDIAREPACVGVPHTASSVHSATAGDTCPQWIGLRPYRVEIRPFSLGTRDLDRHNLIGVEGNLGRARNACDVATLNYDVSVC